MHTNGPNWKVVGIVCCLILVAGIGIYVLQRSNVILEETVGPGADAFALELRGGQTIHVDMRMSYNKTADITVWHKETTTVLKELWEVEKASFDLFIPFDGTYYLGCWFSYSVSPTGIESEAWLKVTE